MMQQQQPLPAQQLQEQLLRLVQARAATRALLDRERSRVPGGHLVMKLLPEECDEIAREYARRTGGVALISSSCPPDVGLLHQVMREIKVDRAKRRLAEERPDRSTSSGNSVALKLLLRSAWALLREHVGVRSSSFKGALPTGALCCPKNSELVGALRGRPDAALNELRGQLDEHMIAIDALVAAHHADRLAATEATAQAQVQAEAVNGNHHHHHALNALVPLYLLHGAARWRRALTAVKDCINYIADCRFQANERQLQRRIMALHVGVKETETETETELDCS